MNDGEIVANLMALEALGIAATMVGILRARMLGLLTAREYSAIKEWATRVRGVPQNWYRVLVWSV